MATGNEYTTLTGLLKGIADALRAKIGTTAQINAQDFPSNIAGIPKAAGNASTSDVLSGVTFSNKNGGEQTGAMPNNGSISKSISPGDSYTVPAGYHNGSGTVSAVANTGTAETSHVLEGKTFYGSGATKQTGAMPNNSAKHIKSTNLSDFRFPHDTTEDGQHDESRYIAIGTSQSGYYTTDSSLIVEDYLFGNAESELVAKGWTFTSVNGLCVTGTLPLLDYDLTDGVLDIWEVEL